MEDLCDESKIEKEDRKKPNYATLPCAFSSRVTNMPFLLV
jgi:hypothetical protein